MESSHAGCCLSSFMLCILRTHMNEWLAKNERACAGVVVALAFVVRLWAAHGTFLNPDEALHFQIANHPSWMESYRASLTTAHPPLLIFVLHFWRGCGNRILLVLVSLDGAGLRNRVGVGGTGLCLLPPAADRIVCRGAAVRLVALLRGCGVGSDGNGVSDRLWRQDVRGLHLGRIGNVDALFSLVLCACPRRLFGAAFSGGKIHHHLQSRVVR